MRTSRDNRQIIKTETLFIELIKISLNLPFVSPILHIRGCNFQLTLRKDWPNVQLNKAALNQK